MSETVDFQQLYEELFHANAASIGYPCAKDYDGAEMAPFLNIALNNVGDPRTASTYKVDSRAVEREVVRRVADWVRAPEDDRWGYVTNGGTEGNLYGLYLARELYPDGVVYFSEDTHYSISKNVHLLNMRHIMIRSQANGEMDYEDLRETLRIHRDRPAIIVANIGTTMTEAKDDIGRIKGMLRGFAMRHYIHCDAALCGLIAPFLEPRPPFDFEDGADSLAISGHKFLGSPMPCGVVVAKQRNVDRIARSIAYIDSLDTTITGSRNGFTPLWMYWRLHSLGEEGLRRRVNTGLDNAAWLLETLQAHGIEAWRNPNALTVMFPAPSKAIIDRFQLATHNGWSHVICMPGVEREHLQAFVTAITEQEEA